MQEFLDRCQTMFEAYPELMGVGAVFSLLLVGMLVSLIRAQAIKPPAKLSPAAQIISDLLDKPDEGWFLGEWCESSIRGCMLKGIRPIVRQVTSKLFHQSGLAFDFHDGNRILDKQGNHSYLCTTKETKMLFKRAKALLEKMVNKEADKFNTLGLDTLKTTVSSWQKSEALKRDGKWPSQKEVRG